MLELSKIKNIKYANLNRTYVIVNNNVRVNYPLNHKLIQKWLGLGNKIEQPEIKEESYIEKRLKEYPEIGEQLDAMLKYFSSRRLQGENLPEDLDSVVGKWLAVKKKYPKA